MNDERDFLAGLRAEVEIELAEAGRSEEEAGLPAADWLFDPAETEREEIGLRGLLGAVEALEGGLHRPDGA
ncbi:hypothetical protein MF672_033455 [Actinomadura sp. ATCC 31491]|uniref:Uncharacterized protein n=1 Tax=Actinomadura luzonensis TaxID=2805427 RepID=A0ABT0G233_9ACTN|nr:hypothetical protein [Actinomadura luzonensis]MCK2218667.1 hypothetical protein [Actinomadura luzonensis]